MKTVLIILVAFGIGAYGGWGAASDQVVKNLTQYMQTPEGVEGCRQIVRSAGG